MQDSDNFQLFFIKSSFKSQSVDTTNYIILDGCQAKHPLIITNLKPYLISFLSGSLLKDTIKSSQYITKLYCSLALLFVV